MIAAVSAIQGWQVAALNNGDARNRVSFIRLFEPKTGYTSQELTRSALPGNVVVFLWLALSARLGVLAEDEQLAI
ncbi:hypothetical protein I8F96_11245, partial [Enterococcus casseliflavus]|nr:hypothetical protein [Enterococcus casseliflavus]